MGLLIMHCKAVQGGDARARSSEGQPFDERDYLRCDSTRALVSAVMRIEGNDATDPVALVPAMKGPCGNPGLPCENRERDLVFDMQPKHTPPLGHVHESPTPWCSRAPRGHAGAGTKWPGSIRLALPHPLQCGPSDRKSVV